MKRTASLLQITLTIILLAVSPSKAQNLFNTAQSLVSTEAYLSRDKCHPGSRVHLAVRATIAEGWHINSTSPPDQFMIPTILKVSVPQGVKVEKILYPEPEKKSLELSDSPLPLYHGTVIFGAVLRISEDLEAFTEVLTATLEYQGCNDHSCLQPAASSARVELAVVEQSVETRELNRPIFSAAIFRSLNDPEKDSREQASGGAAGAEESGGIQEVIEQRGLLLSFIFIFLGGLALNLTPCIYPLIPITVSFFGGQAGGKTSRVFFLSLLYVLGISITYSILGLIAASTENILGSAMQSIWGTGFVAAVLVALALSMFGLWEIRLPFFITSRTGSARQGFLGALFMGLTVGIVAAPCIGPFILGLLLYVGNTGNPLLGFLMFFTLGLGMGVPFILLGTVSGSISHLPQSGKWLDWVKKIFGYILIIMAVYFLRHTLGDELTPVLYGLAALAAGIHLGWIEKSGKGEKVFGIVKKSVGTLFIAAALVLLFTPGLLRGPQESAGGIQWSSYSSDRLAAARKAGKPVMIEFSADWCIPCHEMENKTFSREEIINLAREFVTLKVDLTNPGGEGDRIKREFNIRGVPTIIFYNSKGERLYGSRVVGFVNHKKLESVMKNVK
ncbi:MAG: thioredoxin fold domain-containing protein [Candidatus Latescibacteria bacterium]|nr:thioredoxin fold domain-containing protein [bacterium]MBD3424629.1 thioredoxin fold domain-containing protein [Candidatus Latescibacterota bacterium]